MDFFTVPAMTFGMLSCFFIIRHDRRRILHFNVTRHPTSLWIIQQLREAFPFGSAPRFSILDRDAQYGAEVPAAIRSMKITCVRTSLRSPWQSGIVERWVESLRRDLLDHILAKDSIGNHRRSQCRVVEEAKGWHEPTPQFKLRAPEDPTRLSMVDGFLGPIELGRCKACLLRHNSSG